MDLRFCVTSTDGSSCVVEVIDNPWYRPDEPDDHWEITSGGLSGLTARSGQFQRFANLLNLIGLARLNVRTPVNVGDTGDGVSAGSTAVSWELIGLVP